MAHWGDWSLMQFNFRVVGEISKIPHIHSIFGAKMLLPCERVDLDPYNTDPTLGKISGFLCFVDPTHFKFSYNPEEQVLKVSFTYKTYRWVNEQGAATLRAFHHGDHPNGPNFPAKGLRVSIFWQEFQEWYPATVKRWCPIRNAWVLQYDHWIDSVYEDVPISQWRFFT